MTETTNGSTIQKKGSHEISPMKSFKVPKFKSIEDYDDEGDRLFEEQNYVEAIAHFKKALDLRMIVPIETIQVAMTNSSIGQAYLKMRKFWEALAWFKKALDVCLTCVADHIHTAEQYYHIGDTLVTEERYDESLEYFQKGLDMLNRLNQERSSDAWKYFKRYGDALNGTHRTQTAIENLNQALSIAQGTEGLKSSEAAQIYYSLGNCYLNRGDKSNAQKFYELASEIRMGLPESQKALGDTYHALAMVRMGDSQADLFFKQEIEARRKENFGDEESIEVAKTYMHMAENCMLQQSRQQAEEYLMKAYLIIDRKYSTKGPDYANLCKFLGMIQLEKGNINKGLEWFEEPVRVRCELYRKDSVRVGEAYLDLGQAYNLSQQYKKAAEVYKTAAKILEGKLGKRDPRVIETLFKIGQMYNLANSDENAVEYVKRGIGNLVQALDHDPSGTMESEAIYIFTELYITDKVTRALVNQKKEMFLDNKIKLMGVDSDLMAYIKEKVKAIVEQYDDSGEKLAMLLKVLCLSAPNT